MPIVKTRPGQPIQVEGQGTIITQTPVVTTGAYSANEAVGGMMTFENAALDTGGGGIINHVLLIDDAGQDADMELWLFDTAFLSTDSQAFIPAEASVHTLITVITISSAGWLIAGTPSVNVVSVFGQRYESTTKDLYGQLVTRGTPTFTAVDDLTVRLGLTQVT